MVPVSDSTKADIVEIDVTPVEAFVVPQEKAANMMATFGDRVLTEFKVAKHVQEAAESISDAIADLRTSVGVRSKLGEKRIL